QGNIQVYIGSMLTDADDIDGAADTYHRALHLFRQTNSLSSIASTHLLLGSLYMDRLGRYDLAFDHYVEAQQIYDDIGDYHMLADVWYRLGLACLRDGSPQHAQTAWQTAMLLAKHVGYDNLVL